MDFMNLTITVTGSWNRFKLVSTMVSSIFIPLAILHLLIIRDASGHGALIEPPMRSVLWKYGFDAPINYNYMELYCGGFQNFQNNGGRCGVCGDPFHGPYENERGGKYDLGIIARSYTEDTTSIEVKVEITAHHKGYIEFKLCPNDEAEVTQECLDRYPLKIEEGTQQGDPIKFYPPDGQVIHSLKVSIPPDIRCERCVLQWTYRAGNRWGMNPDGKSCLGCGIQETFINCADISIGSLDTIVNSRIKSVDSLPTSDQAQSFDKHRDKVIKTPALSQELNGIAPNNKEPNIKVTGTRGQLSNNIMAIPPEPQRPLNVKDTHPDQSAPIHKNKIQSHFDARKEIANGFKRPFNSIEKQQVIVSNPHANRIPPIDIIQRDQAIVSPGSDAVRDELTSHTSFVGGNKDILRTRQEQQSSLHKGQDSNRQQNDRKQDELEHFLARLPREKKVINPTSRKDERQPATVIEALQDALKTFHANGVGLVQNNVHSSPRFSNLIDPQLHSTGWTDPRSVLRPLESQWISSNYIVHPRVVVTETGNQLLHNNASNAMPQPRFHSAAPHNDMIIHTREGVSQAHLQSLQEQRIAASARPASMASHPQMQRPFQDTSQWINPMQIPFHQGHSLTGQEQLPRISPSNAFFFPVNEIHTANAVHTQALGIRQPHGIIMGLSPDVQRLMALTSSQVQEFYQRLALVASLNNPHQLNENLQHAWQTPIQRDRATLAAIQSLHSAVPNTIHREALIRNTILTERQLRMDRRFSHGV